LKLEIEKIKKEKEDLKTINIEKTSEISKLKKEIEELKDENLARID
jgi:hypothetical protein